LGKGLLKFYPKKKFAIIVICQLGQTHLEVAQPFVSHKNNPKKGSSKMKIKPTPTGWAEITTKRIKVTGFSEKPFMKVKDWLSSSLRLFKGIPRKRKSCNKCRTRWAHLPADSNINLVFTNKGNKIICDDCFKELKNSLTF
jgi:hypothetical protein